jgi:hypothetical protein
MPRPSPGFPRQGDLGVATGAVQTLRPPRVSNGRLSPGALPVFVPVPAALVGACAALVTAAALAAVPRDAHAQRRSERCRYYADGRWYSCDTDRTVRTVRTVRRTDSYYGGARRQVTLGVGVLQYDLGGRETIPMAALRGDWRLSRLWRGELGLAYGFGDLPRAPGDPAVGLVNAHVLTPTVGLLAELPTPYLRPYAGAAAGVFARFDDGDDFVRPTLAFPVGLRAVLSPRVALRAEARFRFDQQPTGASAPNRELTAGLSVGY